MRVRTRLVLDIVLAAAFVIAFNPVWTGIPVHQWLSIAIIAPVVVHLGVNWEWAVRMVSRFFQKLLSVSRLNFVVDVALLVATVTVMLSGFMVSPGLFAAFGIKFVAAPAWITLHSLSADGTIALFALHALLHAKWAVGVVRRWAAERSALRPSARPLVPGATPALVTAAAPARASRRPALRTGRDRSRAAARERATVLRTVSALGLSMFVGVAVFVSVGLAQPHRAVGATKVASATQRCPKTGCTATGCHATAGKTALAYYGRARLNAWMSHTTTAKQSLASHVTTRRAPTAQTVGGTSGSSASNAGDSASAARKAAAKAAAKRKAAAKKKAAAKAKATAKAKAKASAKAKAAATAKAKAAAKRKAAAKKTVTKKRRTCPVTGCSAYSCHGSNGVSARVWYRTHS